MMAELLKDAARGDREAQGQLASYAVNAVIAGECPPEEGFARAELMARLATNHGGASDHVDFKGLAAILLLRARAEDQSAGEVAAREAEAIQILNALADEGDEEAARLVAMAGDMCGASAWALLTAER